MPRACNADHQVGSSAEIQDKTGRHGPGLVQPAGAYDSNRECLPHAAASHCISNRLRANVMQESGAKPLRACVCLAANTGEKPALSSTFERHPCMYQQSHPDRQHGIDERDTDCGISPLHPRNAMGARGTGLPRSYTILREVSRRVQAHQHPPASRTAAQARFGGVPVVQECRPLTNLSTPPARCGYVRLIHRMGASAPDYHADNRTSSVRNKSRLARGPYICYQIALNHSGNGHGAAREKQKGIREPRVYIPLIRSREMETIEQRSQHNQPPRKTTQCNRKRCLHPAAQHQTCANAACRNHAMQCKPPNRIRPNTDNERKPPIPSLLSDLSPICLPPDTQP